MPYRFQLLVSISVPLIDLNLQPICSKAQNCLPWGLYCLFRRPPSIVYWSVLDSFSNSACFRCVIGIWKVFGMFLKKCTLRDLLNCSDENEQTRNMKDLTTWHSVTGGGAGAPSPLKWAVPPHNVGTSHMDPWNGFSAPPPGFNSTHPRNIFGEVDGQRSFEICEIFRFFVVFAVSTRENNFYGFRK